MRRIGHLSFHISQLRDLLSCMAHSMCLWSHLFHAFVFFKCEGSPMWLDLIGHIDPIFHQVLKKWYKIEIVVHNNTMPLFLHATQQLHVHPVCCIVFWVNAWNSGPIFQSQCFFNVPHCIATSVKNTLDISSTF
jgi:hypothetical protein